MPKDSFDHVSFSPYGITKSGRYGPPSAGIPAPAPALGGALPYLPATSAALIEHLGVDGSVSLDISGETHLWHCEAVPTVDVGSLAHTDYDYEQVGIGTVPTATTHADFWGGAANVLEHTSNLNTLGRDVSARVPNPMDGTKSFIAGGAMQWDGVASSGSFVSVVTQYNSTSTRGWFVFAANTGGDVRKLRAQYISGPGFTLTDVTATVAVPLGTPFVWILNACQASGKLKLMTSEGGYSEVTLNGNGDIDHAGIVARTGYDAGLPGVGPEGITGFVGQLWTVQYAAALDAGISAANMTNFMSYTTGALP